MITDSKMSVVAESSTDHDGSKPQSFVERQLVRAHDARRDDNLRQAIAELETAYAQAQKSPYEITFQTRIQLIFELAEAYLQEDDRAKARRLLSSEAAFAEQVFQIIQATGTAFQKREAAGARLQIRDRARQIALLGAEAPEITIKHWLNGQPATLASLRGRVVLLEFWATWCKPCQEMFPKLTSLDEAFRERGLEIIAITRHYLAQRGTAESETDELKLMRSVIEDHEVEFRVGVAEDEGLQELYGANGLPTLALIDRRGIVRYAHFGGGQDENLRELLTECLDEPL